MILGYLVLMGLLTPHDQETSLRGANGAGDFDFLIGKHWQIHNRVLQKRLAGSDEWTEFDAELYDVRPILAGLGNVDRFVGTRDGKPFEASSVRIFHPGEEKWTIYWVDTLSHRLTEQVVGGFEDGVGEFFGYEVYEGRRRKMRFLWKDISETSAYWEQAYFDEDDQRWEANWIMEFRVKP